MKKILSLFLISLLLPSVVLAQLTVPQGGTGRAFFPLGGWIFSDSTLRLNASSSPTANYFTATSTSQSSIFPILRVTLSGALSPIQGLWLRSTDVAERYATIVIDNIPTANRSLTFDLQDGNRSITLTGNPTLDNWFDQNVKTTASPTFANLTLTTKGTIPYASTTAISVSDTASTSLLNVDQYIEFATLPSCSNTSSSRGRICALSDGGDPAVNRPYWSIDSTLYDMTGGGSAGATALPGLSDVLDDLVYTSGHYLRANGSAFTNSALLASDLSGIVGITNGGTGIASTPSYGQLLMGNNSSAYELTATSSLGLVSKTGNETIAGVKTFSSLPESDGDTPTTANQFVTFSYVSGLGSGQQYKSAVSAATTSNLTLSGTQTIDGVAGSVGMRTLAAGQTNTGENGCYLQAAGAWSRCTDYDTTAEITLGSSFPVTNGTANSGSIFIQSSEAPANVGTDPITFTKYTPPAYTGTSPITVSGNNISLGSAVTAALGGTGQTSYTIGDILYASAANALSKLAGVATGNALISGGVGAAPSWGKIGLTTHVSGTLPIANGGTNLTTATDDNVMVGNGTTWQTKAVSDCDTSSSALTYDTATNAFGCNSISGSGGGAGNTTTYVATSTYKTSNESINNSTLQNDDNLYFQIAANETWTVTYVLDTTLHATPDWKFAITAPTGATCQYYGTDPSASIALSTFSTKTATCGTTKTYLTTTGEHLLYIHATIVNGANAGTVNLQWAQNSTSAGNAVLVNAGSYLQAVSNTRAGTPPGGSDTQVQFNDSGSFGGDAGLTYNKTADRLTTTYASSTALTVSSAGFFPSGIWNSSGNLGIGTTSPYAKLTIGSGNIALDNNQIIAATSNGTEANWGLGTLNLNSKIDTTGSALGTTYISSANGADAGGGNVYLGVGNSGAGGNVIMSAGTSNGKVGVGTTSPFGALSVEMTTTNPSLVVSNQGSTSPALWVSGVNQNGNIGIGTSTPWAKLDINAAANEPALKLFDSAGTSQWVFYSTNNTYSQGITPAGTAYGWNSCGYNLTSCTELMRLSRTGRLGIDNANPQSYLHVSDDDISGDLTVLSFGTDTAIPVYSGLPLRVFWDGTESRLEFDSGVNGNGIAIWAGSMTSDAFVGGSFSGTTISGTTISASTAFRAPAGSLTVPGYSATNDTNTGMNLPGSDVLNLITAGLNRLHITSGGNVGVSSSTPFAKLSVHALNGETNSQLFTVASSTASATTTLFTVLNGGNVGIGTIPSYKLHVDGQEAICNGACGTVNNTASGNLYIEGKLELDGTAEAVSGNFLCIEADGTVTKDNGGLTCIGAASPFFTLFKDNKKVEDIEFSANLDSKTKADWQSFELKNWNAKNYKILINNRKAETDYIDSVQVILYGSWDDQKTGNLVYYNLDVTIKEKGGFWSKLFGGDKKTLAKKDGKELVLEQDEKRVVEIEDIPEGFTPYSAVLRTYGYYVPYPKDKLEVNK